MMGMGIIELIIVLLFVGVATLGTAFWIWMLIDCAKHERTEGNDRLIWILVIALLHLPGALIYFFVRKLAR